MIISINICILYILSSKIEVQHKHVSHGKLFSLFFSYFSLLFKAKHSNGMIWRLTLPSIRLSPMKIAKSFCLALCKQKLHGWKGKRYAEVYAMVA